VSSVNLVDCLSATLAFLERIAAPVETYGFFGGGNPHEFRPDEENAPEEIAAHRGACEAWDRGDRPELPASGRTELVTIQEMPDGAGGTLPAHTGPAIVCGGSFGAGVYTYRDPEAVRLIAELKGLLAAPAPEAVTQTPLVAPRWSGPDAAESLLALRYHEIVLAAGRVVDGYDASEGPAWPAVETLSRTLAGRR
jgi:hypothetical protein